MGIKLIIFLNFSFILLSCGDLEPPQKKNDQIGYTSKDKIYLGDPTSIPNTDLLVYQVFTKKMPKNKFEEKLADKLPSLCWNLLFQDLRTDSSYFLESKKMIVESFYPKNNKFPLLFYKIKANDTDGNKKLTPNDFSYLYCSDPNGEKLRQISPNGYHVEEWLFTESKLILMTCSNKSEIKKYFKIDLDKETKPELVEQFFKKAELDSAFYTHWK